MRHRKSGRKLGVTASHRKAMLNALCSALIRHKKIQTTTAKAKEARMVVEKLLTRAKNAVAAETKGKDIHARRQVARMIHDRDDVRELFTEIAPKIANAVPPVHFISGVPNTGNYKLDSAAFPR